MLQHSASFFKSPDTVEVQVLRGRFHDILEQVHARAFVCENFVVDSQGLARGAEETIFVINEMIHAVPDHVSLAFLDPKGRLLAWQKPQMDFDHLPIFKRLEAAKYHLAAKKTPDFPVHVVLVDPARLPDLRLPSGQFIPAPTRLFQRSILSERLRGYDALGARCITLFGGDAERAALEESRSYLSPQTNVQFIPENPRKTNSGVSDTPVVLKGIRGDLHESSLPFLICLGRSLPDQSLQANFVGFQNSLHSFAKIKRIARRTSVSRNRAGAFAEEDPGLIFAQNHRALGELSQQASHFPSITQYVSHAPANTPTGFAHLVKRTLQPGSMHASYREQVYVSSHARVHRKANLSGFCLISGLTIVPKSAAIKNSLLYDCTLNLDGIRVEKKLIIGSEVIDIKW